MEERLERLREALCVDWGELCARLEIGQSMMHYLRKGERQPSPKLLRRIAALESELHKSPTSQPLHAVRESGPTYGTPQVPAAGNSTREEFQLLEERLDRAMEEILEVKKQIRRMKP